MTTLSRRTRIGLLLRTAPSETRQPAMFPNRLERNTSRTSAIPMMSSLNCGASMPVIACFTVSMTS